MQCVLYNEICAVLVAGGVATAHPDVGRVGLAEQPRLAALGLEVRVAAEEGRQRRRLVPAREQLRLGVAEEAANIRATVGQTRHV